MTKVVLNQINMRVPAEVVSDLDMLAQQAQVSRVDVARQILLEGIQRRKREYALKL